MTGRRPVRKRAGSGKGLLLVVALVLAAGVVKYTDAPFAVTARQKAAEVLAGAPGVDKVLTVFSGTDTPLETGEQEYAASSGGAEDVLGRTHSLFPDTVDDTVHTMSFDHVMPVAGVLTSPFGSRVSPTTGETAFHYGLDLAADEGTPITAFADGTVREVGESDYGKYLIVDHAGGFSTLYAHCSSILMGVGDEVQCGGEIALVGQTGDATGPHLHLELWKDGMALDPADYLEVA